MGRISGGSAHYAIDPASLQGRRPTALRAAAIANHPKLIPSVRRQASTLLSIHEINPRLAAVFATQQRWLIAHLALAQCNISHAPRAGVAADQICRGGRRRSPPSRNTADACLKEMLRYGYVRQAQNSGDRRIRPLEPSPLAIQTVSHWLAARLATLDELDRAAAARSFWLAQSESPPFSR
jgi:hypothetical protein